MMLHLNYKKRLLIQYLVMSFAFIQNGKADDLKLTKQLQDQLEKTKSTLGELKPFQEEVFSSEILNNTGRFIKDYSQKNGKLFNVIVDEVGLKRYLAFHATSSGLVSNESKKILLSVSQEGECSSCGASLEKIKKEWKEKFERRGLTVLTLSESDSKKDPIDLLTQKNAGAWMRLKVISERDIDHVGESMIHAKMDLKFPGSLLSHVQREVEVPPRDSIDVSLSRLFIEAMTSLGADTLKRTDQELLSDDGFKVSVKKIKSFNDLQAIKRTLSSFSDKSKVVEYEISKDSTTFAIYPLQSKKAFFESLKKSSSQINGDENAEIVEVSVAKLGSDTQKNGATP